MKAAVHERYGSPDAVVEIRELDKPEPADDEVLVRVQASSVNIAEWYGVTGRPWIARPTTGLRGPKDIRLGVDYAGIVESVGKDVTDFRAGDDVFGGRSGAWAEYVCVRAERAIVTKPGTVTFEHAGAVGTAAITALQALRDKGGLMPGQRVLINGASGGVGTYAVQIAKALGAEVTAVCSTPNIEIARSLGADVVIDYRVEDVTQGSERYDLVVDIAGTRSFDELRRVLEPGATVVVVGGPRANRLLGPIGHVVGSRLRAIRGSQRATFFIAKFNKADMETLRDLMESGKLTSVIDSTYPLDEIAGALQHMGEGHPRGKIVVTICVRASPFELLLDEARVEAARGEQHVGVEPEVGDLLHEPLVALGCAGERDLDAFLANLARSCARPCGDEVRRRTSRRVAPAHARPRGARATARSTRPHPCDTRGRPVARAGGSRRRRSPRGAPPRRACCPTSRPSARAPGASG